MEILYACLFLLFSSGLGNPFSNRLGLKRAAETLTEKGGYGIVGSKTADIEKYPYTVSLTYVPQNYLLGGGAILNRNWIVCSAYEICDIKPQDLSVRVGSNNAAIGGKQLNVSKIILHEKFQIGYPYDVAVVKTATPIKFNKKAKPIRLAKAASVAGTKAQITGFGDTTTSSPNSRNLQVAIVQVKTESECKHAHPSCENTCICADADNVGPCYNDIGDPLVKKNQLIGWFLGGDYCNFFGQLDLYCNVVPIRQWILDTIKQNSSKEEMEGIDDDKFYRAFDEDSENGDD